MVQFKPLVLACAFGASVAFVPQSPSLLAKKPQQHVRPLDGVALKAAVDPEAVVPTVIFVAGVAATMYKDAKPDAFVPKGKKTAAVKEVEAEPEPAPAPKKFLNILRNPAPAPAPEVEEEMEAEPEPEPEPAPAPVVEAGQDISAIKKEVASTLEEEQEKMDRLKAAEEAKKVEEEEEEADAEPEPVEEKSRLKRVKRVLKKIVMPWKKWSDIS